MAEEDFQIVADKSDNLRRDVIVQADPPSAIRPTDSRCSASCGLVLG